MNTYELRNNQRAQEIRGRNIAAPSINNECTVKAFSEFGDNESLFLDTEFLQRFLNREPANSEVCEDGAVKTFSIKKVGICPLCNNKEPLIRHHIKYDSSYRNEETISICRSCHNKIHINLRKAGACVVPVDELAKLSKMSSTRFARVSGVFPVRRIVFSNTLVPNVEVQEVISYNENTGNVSITSCFHTYNHKELLHLDCAGGRT